MDHSARQLRPRLSAAWLLPLTLTLIVATAASGVVLPNTGQHEQRNFDARLGANTGLVAPVRSQDHLRAVEDLRAQLPELAVTYEPLTSAVHSIYNRTGYLTAAVGLADPQAIALGWLNDNLELLGLSARDLRGFEVTDSVFNRATGATHVYLRQQHHGLALYNGQLHVNVNRDGRIISVNNAFMPGLAGAVNSVEPLLGAEIGVQRAASHIGLEGLVTPVVLSRERSPRRVTEIARDGLSLSPIRAELMVLPIHQGDARLVWNFQLETLDGEHYYDMTVDALTGEIWTRFDWTNSGTYRVYEQPVESPNHTSPAPPADARTLAVDPENGTASPSGWFTGGTMSGNNVHACLDAVANNVCDSPEPSCSGTTCDFSINLGGAPSTYTSAAIANLFYWNNIIHDVQYQYGFDEAGGNFQENNFGNGGSGSDSVNADAQDGGGNCNANFSTPTDGGNPRMQMFTCDIASPTRDGDLDNNVIVHEYGHGISIRQVGGPGNSSCLNNSQQAGEGWSDFLGLAYTGEVGDQGTDKRGLGTYLFGQDADGDGIRDLPYSTDPAINNWTYESISGAGIPHGVGSRWAQSAWEVYWTLVDQYGFDSDLYNALGGAGNQRAMLYINEGLKNTACSPTFVDNRDGIIQAATDNFGGTDVCLLWEAFAAFGLGTDAVSGGSNSTNPTNGFAVPAECSCQPNPIADAGADQNICLGDSATVGTAAQAGHSYSWTPGGQATAQITVTPTVDTTYTVTASTVCGSANDAATVFVDNGSGGGLDDDFEGSNSDWTASGLWHEAVNSTCAGANSGFTSPVTAFYYGQEASCTYDSGAANSGSLTSPSIGGITSSSTLSFNYYRQVESFSGDFDRTTVDVVSSSGTTTVFSLNSSNASAAGWVASGSISLAAFAGENIQIVFNFDTVDNVGNAFDGWFIDDVAVTGDSPCTPGNTPPTVNITSPPNGTTVNEGTSITFIGNANDSEDGDLTSSISWSSSINGALGSGGSVSATLSPGTHTITASVTDSGGASGSNAISVTIDPVGGGCTDCIDWNVTGTVSYSNQDSSANVSVEDGGDTLLLLDNTWRRTTQTFVITANTVVEFEFSSAVQGEIHGLGFDEDDTLTNDVRIFQVHGTQNWSSANHDFDNYAGGGAFTTYQIPVGQFYTGTMFLVLVNDNDAGSGNDSRFRNVRVFENTPPPGSCAADVDFEAGAAGWTNNGASTCTTGDFVIGTPTQVVASGVTTQLAGDHTTGSGNAFFSAVNTSAGVNDVDGGNCIVTSPVYAVTEASDVSVWYYHGQRDAGDDASGDFFLLEMSTNGGSTWTTLSSVGDVVSNAAWTEATTSATAGDNVQFRIQVSDGAGPGDLVEAGVDDVMICPQ